MIRIKNIFSGATTITGGSATSQDITIGTVSDVNKTLFFYTAYYDRDTAFSREAISVRLSDASTLNVQWINTYGQAFYVYMQWYVIEFVEGVTVQHYYSASKPSTPITVNQVDTSKSFIIPSWGINNTEGSSNVVDTGANFSFADSTSVTFTNSGSSIDRVAMQVVQWDGAVSQQSITNINASTPVDITINAVKESRAVVFSSNNWTSASQPTAVNQFARCFLQNSTTLRLDVIQTGYTQDIAAFVVTIPQFDVQRGLQTFVEDTSESVSINTVDSPNTIPWVSMPNRPYAVRGEPSTGDVYHGAHATRLTLDSATQFTITRGRPWSPILVDWQILEFEPPPPRHSFVMHQDPGML